MRPLLLALFALASQAAFADSTFLAEKVIPLNSTRANDVLDKTAADIRKVRPPEPYHGKGIHYLGERIRRKAGKAGKGAK